MTGYVSKDELEEFFKSITITNTGRTKGEAIRAVYISEVLKAVYNGVMNLPTTDAVPVEHGKWLYGEDESGYDGYYCSKCFGHVQWYGKASGQSINFIKKYNYCPNCGKRMDEE